MLPVGSIKNRAGQYAEHASKSAVGGGAAYWTPPGCRLVLLTVLEITVRRVGSESAIRIHVIEQESLYLAVLAADGAGNSSGRAGGEGANQLLRKF